MRHFRPRSGLRQQVGQECTYVVVPESDQNSRGGDLDGDGDTAEMESMWSDKHRTLGLTLVTLKNIYSVLVSIHYASATHIKVIL
jgi:hypothetical protein